MTLTDGIAGILRKRRRDADLGADLGRLLRAVAGGGCQMAMRALSFGEWDVGLGVAWPGAAGLPAHRIHALSEHVSGDILAWCGYETAKSSTGQPVAEYLLDSAHASLLQAAREWRGAFGAAFWRPSEGTLAIVRDHAGQRPLYFCTPDDGFAFASRLGALVDCGLTERRIEPGAIESYLFNGFVVSPGTMMANARAVLPGQAVIFATGDGLLRKRWYWTQPDSRAVQIQTTRAQHLEHVRDAFENALTRTASDFERPGAFLSGGLDSSMIVAAAHTLLGEISTLSVGMLEKEYDESDQASWIAKRYSRHHIVSTIQQRDLEAHLDEAIAAMDQPSHDGFNVYLASKAAAAHDMRHMLSGLGGDEVFGGYPDIAWLPPLAQADSFASHIPARFKNLGLKIAGANPFRIGSAAKLAEVLNHPADGPFPPNGHFMRNLAAAYQTLYMVFPKWTRDALSGPAVTSAAKSMYFGLPVEFMRLVDAVNVDNDVPSAIFRLNSMLFLSERVLRDTYSMADSRGIDVRAPMVDVDFIEALWTVPIAERAGNRQTKQFQLDVMRHYVGDAFPQRRKRGFVLPFDVWMRSGKLAAALAETLNDAPLAAAIGLEPRGVAELHRSFVEKRLPVPWHSIWSVFVLLRWCAKNGATIA